MNSKKEMSLRKLRCYLCRIALRIWIICGKMRKVTKQFGCRKIAGKYVTKRSDIGNDNEVICV